MKKVIQVLNVVTLLFTILINYTYSRPQPGRPAISEISARYDNLFTPAGYAFGIWGLIYAGLLLFAGYQLRSLFNKKTEDGFVTDIGWWFIIANLANAAWVAAFTQDHIGLSVLLILVIFIALLIITLRTNMERWDAPDQVIVFIWWPFSFYFGWITVALIANIAAWLTALGWHGAPLHPETWTILVLLLATAVFLAMTWKRNMREYASVGAWGFAAIAVKNWHTAPAVAWTAAVLALTLMISSGRHGYLNRATAPFKRKR